MTLYDLIQRCRSETQDTASPQLWSDDEWMDYLNEATEEACIRARLIENESLELSSSANDPYAEIPEYAWSIQRVTFDGRALELVDKQMINDSEGPLWEAIAGTPRFCYEVGGKLRFYPIPEVEGVVKAHAFCTPEDPMTQDGDEPQGIKARLHGKLVDGALGFAYQKKDSDTFDANLATIHESIFERTFGPRPDEKALRRLRINVRRHVKGAYF